MIIFSENKIFSDLNEIVNEIVNFWKLGGGHVPPVPPPPLSYATEDEGSFSVRCLR
jgi:hypothetical protein